jgi:hypothetical protein
LISSFQSPRFRCVHVSRFCGWNSLRGGKRGHSEERLLSWVQRGVLFLFLHGRLRFGRHYMIVRFDEEITTNSHVSGWGGGSRKSKHLGRGRWKISGRMDRTVYN